MRENYEGDGKGNPVKPSAGRSRKHGSEFGLKPGGADVFFSVYVCSFVVLCVILTTMVERLFMAVGSSACVKRTHIHPVSLF